MEDENDILIEDYNVKDMLFNGGISGTTAVLVGAVNIFGKRALNKKPKSELDHVKHINYSGGNIWWK